MQCFKLGEIGFGFDTANSFRDKGNISHFRIDENEFNELKDKNIFSVCENDDISVSGTKPIFFGDDYSVYEVDGGYTKVTQRYCGKPYKCVCFQSGSGGQISFTEDGLEHFESGEEAFRLIDLVSSLACYDAFIMHGSVIRNGDKCVIFSGDSGAGKSTQAELWKKYRGSEILNGDRVLLRRIDNIWYAFGLPMSGSSTYCEQYKLEVSAVCFLGKAPFNFITKPLPIQQFMLLSAQITCGARKAGDSIKLVELTEDFMNKTDIIAMNCRKDESAVEFLDHYLNER